jgi:hypothetical protein
MSPETDKIWPHTGIIVYGSDIQSDPHESEIEIMATAIPLALDNG